MDLMGLEESVDFWDMGINDQGEILVPIKDLTKQSSFRHACPNPFCILITLSAGDNNSNAKKPNVKKANGKAAPKLLDALDSIGVAPKKLPNGNYECVCECFECKHVSGLLFSFSDAIIRAKVGVLLSIFDFISSHFSQTKPSVGTFGLSFGTTSLLSMTSRCLSAAVAMDYPTPLRLPRSGV